MATISIFRDTLTLDADLGARLANAGTPPQPGDTVVVGARDLTLKALPDGYSYVIVAESLTVAGGPITLTPNARGAASVAVYARAVGGTLNLSCPGTRGANGANGTIGFLGDPDPGDDPGGGPRVKPRPRPKGYVTPGGAGGDGSAGGAITVRYGAGPAPAAAAPGGAGGAGGKGAPNGPAGRAGPNGPTSVQQVAAGHAFDAVGRDVKAGWAAYRTEVGEYRFRNFDAASRLVAFQEFTAALALDPGNARAQTLRGRIIRQQTPTGMPRDLDIAPDYKDIAAGLLGGTQLVLSSFLAVQGTATAGEIAKATRDQLTLMAQQLADREAEAQSNVVIAQLGAEAAGDEGKQLAAQLAALDPQIDAAQHQGLSLTDVLTTVGAVAGIVAGIATGVGAIVAIPAGIAAVGTMVSAGTGVLQILQFEATGNNAPTIGNTKLNSLGTDLSGLVKGASDTLVNFQKFTAEIQGSNASAQLKQLLTQKASLTMQKMIADLRTQQAHDQAAAARQQQTDYRGEYAAALSMLGTWSTDAQFLRRAFDRLLASARAVADLVAQDLFVARRALELYQLVDASTVRFDYGYVHPDEDHDLAADPFKRVQRCLESVGRLPRTVIHWNDVYTAANVSQSGGFDVVHPSIEVVIDDPAALAHLRQKGALLFSTLAPPAGAPAPVMPSGVYELKVNGLSLELVGASATTDVTVWAVHSGHWQMVRPPSVQAAPAQFTLLPHAEAFTFTDGVGAGKRAAIPAAPPSSAEPGPPFSFWGRGALADWTIYPDAGAAGLDLSGLTKVVVRINCIGLMARASAGQASASEVTTIRPQAVGLADATPLLGRAPVRLPAGEAVHPGGARAGAPRVGAGRPG